VLLLSTNLSVASETKQNFWKTQRIPLISYAASQAWDWSATEYQIENCHPWHEQNPLIPKSSLARAGYFMGTGAAVILSSRLLHAHHPRLAAGLLWAGTAIELHAATRTTGGCRDRS